VNAFATKETCPECNKDPRIDTSKIGGMSYPSKTYKGPLSDGQCAVLASAKKKAPRRSFSAGFCGEWVQKILNDTEKTYPGFNRTPIPGAGGGRYPIATNFSEGFGGKTDISGKQTINGTGFLDRNGWTKLSVSRPEEAPPGSVIIFRGPKDPFGYKDSRNPRNNLPAYVPGMRPAGDWVGHVTIKGDDGLWYTDGRTPMASPAQDRTFVAAFMPGPEQNKASAGACDAYKKSPYGVDAPPPEPPRKKRRRK
jgi:hypothetical protein